LNRLPRPCKVSIPKCRNIDLENFRFPKCRWFGKKHAVIFLDDFHRLVDQQNFDHLLRTAVEKRVRIVATCRSGIECDKAKKKLLGQNVDLETIFGSNVVEVKKVPVEVGQEVALGSGIKWEAVHFDGTVGSVFLPLGEMKQRFKDCTEEQKTILRVLNTMYSLGIYKEKLIFPLEWVKALASEQGLMGQDYKWGGWLEELKTKEFITPLKFDIQVEEAYLEFVVSPTAEVTDFELWERAIGVYAMIPEALVKLGNRAQDLGKIHLEKAKLVNISIKAYQQALSHWSLGNYPVQFAEVQNNLGNSYCCLGEVEGLVENCKLAIATFQEALKVRTLDRFPMQYAMTQNNLGIALWTLAEVEDKAQNCRMAIAAFQEALKVCTLEDYQMQYATLRNNLGATFYALGEVEGKVENCKLAIGAYQEAMKVYTSDQFPKLYAMTQNNLGGAYSALGEVERDAENCKLAVAAFQNALKYYNPDQMPIQYALTQSNLGFAYTKLGELERKSENCKLAIDAFQEALKVRTLDRFPMDYAVTQNYLGMAYCTLADIEEKAQNCKLAITAFQEALKVHTIDHFPIQYAMIQNNFGDTYATLAEIEDKEENCRKAIEAYHESLKIFTQETFPESHDIVAENLRKATKFCKGE
jgi:tetratricopeptide (TPR) repeat protein